MKTETKYKEIVRQTDIERGREMRERWNKNEGVREKCATVESKRCAESRE